MTAFSMEQVTEGELLIGGYEGRGGVVDSLSSQPVGPVTDGGASRVVARVGGCGVY
jgi:hypothetical protein